MSKLFQIPFFKGSQEDTQGSTITKVGTNGMQQLGKGHSLHCTNSNYVYSNTVSGDYNTIIVEFYLDEEVTSNSSYNFINSLGSYSLFGFGSVASSWSSETFSWWNSNTTNGGYIRDNIPAGYNQIILKHNGSYYDCMLNGVQVTTFVNGSGLFNNSKVYLGARQANISQKFNGDFLNFEVHDNSFSDLQCADKYQEFNNRTFIAPAKKNFLTSTKTFKGDGVSNYVSIPSSVTTGNGDWEVSYESTNKISGYQIIVDAYVGGNNGFYIGYLNGYAYFKYGDGSNTSIISKSCSGKLTTFVAGIRSSAQEMYLIIDGIEYTASISSISQSSFVLKNIGLLSAVASYYNGEITDFKLTKEGVIDTYYKFDEERGTIAYDSSGNGNNGVYHGVDYHGEILEQDVYLNEQFIDSPADGQVSLPIDWDKGTGTYVTKEKGGLDGNSKYRECTVGGTEAIPDNNAYGTWEFDMYNYGSGDAMVHFIRKGKEGYRLVLSWSRRVSLVREGSSVVTLFYTNSNYVEFNTWYRVKVTRSLTGVFTIYIKGGSFGIDSWTLVNTSGGTGSNPITDNTYTDNELLVTDVGAGDSIAKIKHYRGVD